MAKPSRNGVKELEDLPNVGKSIAADLRSIGIRKPAQLRRRSPKAMYEKVCRVKGQRQDPCLLDVFVSAVRYMEGGPPLPWWKFSAARKRMTI
jgi:hypothetical protein